MLPPPPEADGGDAGDRVKSKQSDISFALARRAFHVGTPNWVQQNFTRLTWEWRTFDTYPDLAYGLTTRHGTRGP
jgi:hypothetical protein